MSLILDAFRSMLLPTDISRDPLLKRRYIVTMVLSISIAVLLTLSTGLSERSIIVFFSHVDIMISVFSVLVAIVFTGITILQSIKFPAAAHSTPVHDTESNDATDVQHEYKKVTSLLFVYLMLFSMSLLIKVLIEPHVDYLQNKNLCVWCSSFVALLYYFLNVRALCSMFIYTSGLVDIPQKEKNEASQTTNANNPVPR